MEILCVLQLVDCLYFIGEGMYRQSIVTLSQCKYYINRYAQVMGVKHVLTDEITREGQGLELVNNEPKVISWLKLVCTHRQEVVSLVFMTQRVGPVRDMLQEICNCLPRSESFVEKTVQEIQKIASSLSNTSYASATESGMEDATSRILSSLESSVSKLLSLAREQYGRVALLLVRLPERSDTSRRTGAIPSEQYTIIPKTGAYLLLFVTTILFVTDKSASSQWVW